LKIRRKRREGARDTRVRKGDYRTIGESKARKINLIILLESLGKKNFTSEDALRGGAERKQLKTKLLFSKKGGGWIG